MNDHFWSPVLCLFKKQSNKKQALSKKKLNCWSSLKAFKHSYVNTWMIYLIRKIIESILQRFAFELAQLSLVDILTALVTFDCILLLSWYQPSLSVQLSRKVKKTWVLRNVLQKSNAVSITTYNCINKSIVVHWHKYITKSVTLWKMYYV